MAVAMALNINAQGIEFVEGKTFAEVLDMAKQANKMVFIDCYTSWCGPCKLMATQEFVKKEAGDYFNAKFINFKIDMEKGEGPEIGKKYDVNAYPTFLLLDATGEMKGRLVGSASIGDFIKNVEGALTEETPLLSLQKKYREGNRDPKFIDEYINELTTNYMRGEVKNVVADMLKGKTGLQIAQDKALFDIFKKGNFTVDDPLFMQLYKERATVVAMQGEAAAKDLDGQWANKARYCMKFDGHDYLGIDMDYLEKFKQTMLENNVPGVDEIVDNTLRYNAMYAKDFPTIYQYLEKDIKAGKTLDPQNTFTILSQLAENYSQNKKAMKTVEKCAGQQLAELQKKDTSGEREFTLQDGSKMTMTGYLINQYQELIKQLKNKK